LAYAIDAAMESGLFDTIHVSTDSEQYAEIARKYGADVPFLRSAETSSDMATSDSVIFEVLERYKQAGKTFDTVTLLQPTSPLRIAEDICGAHQVMQEKGAKMVVSVCEVDHSPLWSNTLPEDGCMNGFIRPETNGPRQRLKQYYRINGAVYIMSVEHLYAQGKLIYDQDSYAYVMPRLRSIDIDESIDFIIGEALLKSLKETT